MRRLLSSLILLLLLAGALMAYAAEWSGCKYLTAGTNITITCPDTVGRGGATITGSGGGGTPGGSSGQFQYNNGAGAFAGSAELMRSSGVIVIPNAAVAADAAAFVGTAPGLLLADTTGSQRLNIFVANAASEANGGDLRLGSLNGTYAAPTKTINGDTMGVINFFGYTGAARADIASISVFAMTDGDASPFKSSMFILARGTHGLEIDLNGDSDTLAFYTNNASTAEMTISSGLVTINSAVNVASGGSTTISTGVGSVKMSTANAATNTSWIPIKYAGNTYYVPGWTTNAP